MFQRGAIDVVFTGFEVSNTFDFGQALHAGQRLVG